MIYVDTHSVNLSTDVEEVLALFQVQLIPISAGTPQELSFAETRVKMIRRVSTAMLTGAEQVARIVVKGPSVINRSKKQTSAGLPCV